MFLQRLISLTYLTGLGVILLLALARLLFSPDGTFASRFLAILRAAGYILLWPIALMAPQGRRALADLTPFRNTRRIQ